MAVDHHYLSPMCAEATGRRPCHHSPIKGLYAYQLTNQAKTKESQRMTQECTYLISAYPGFIPFDSTEEGNTRFAFCHTTYRKRLSGSADVDGVNLGLTRILYWRDVDCVNPRLFRP